MIAPAISPTPRKTKHKRPFLVYLASLHSSVPSGFFGILSVSNGSISADRTARLAELHIITGMNFIILPENMRSNVYLISPFDSSPLEARSSF